MPANFYRYESGDLTWQAQYEAYGTQPVEAGSNPDRQRANSKDEDPTGLLNEGFRYRDLETGTFITRDPIGFKDGPNLYTYVHQNPWTKWDPEGLEDKDKVGNVSVVSLNDQKKDKDKGEDKFKRWISKMAEADKKNSPTGHALQQAIEHLGNKVVIVEQSGLLPARTSIEKDGTVKIYINMTVERNHPGVLAHEEAHVIQEAVKYNELAKLGGSAASAKQINDAVQAGRDALNKIAPVKITSDWSSQYKESEALRTENIVNAERTINELPPEKRNESDFKKALPPVQKWHQDFPTGNYFDDPNIRGGYVQRGTEYGMYDGSYVRDKFTK